MTTALLRLEEVSKSFAALKVIDRLSFSLHPGEALGVLGPNGAGKSTVFNLIAGHLAPDSGRIVYDGQDITAMPAAARCRLGIGRSFQIPHPFIGMTVFENLLVGAVFGGGLAEQAAAAHCHDILERTGLAPKANRLAGSLTLLDRKRLELARAMSTRPRLLLLDEIAGGLTDDEAVLLTGTINDLRHEGVSIIWIEHVVHALIAAVDRLLVLHGGGFIAQGDPQAVIRSPAVREIYMGIPADA